MLPAWLALVAGSVTGAPRWDDEGLSQQTRTPEADAQAFLRAVALSDRIDGQSMERAHRASLVAPGPVDSVVEAVERDAGLDAMRDARARQLDRSRFTDYRGRRVEAEAVRYVQDFEESPAALTHWEGLRTSTDKQFSTIAGPYRTGGTSVRLETVPETTYGLRFDLALVGARLGSEDASDTIIVEIDGVPLLKSALSAYSAIALAERENPDDPLVARDIALFFRAGFRISTITFRVQETGTLGGEVWGLDNVVVDRMPEAPAAVEGERPSDFESVGSAAGGASAGASRGRVPSGPAGRGGSGGGGNGGGDGGFDPRDFRLPDETIFPPDEPPIEPAPDLPLPDTPIDPPRNDVPSPPTDPPVDEDPPIVPAPGSGLLLGLSALALGARRHRATR